MVSGKNGGQEKRADGRLNRRDLCGEIFWGGGVGVETGRLDWFGLVKSMDYYIRKMVALGPGKRGCWMGK